MPPPPRKDPEDYFARLDEHQRPHLLELRRISVSYVPAVTEELRWHQPTYLRDGDFRWMLQAFGKHCSLRFSPDFFGSFSDEVAEAGYPSGAGFLKIRYDQEVPEELCRRLIDARLAE